MYLTMAYIIPLSNASDVMDRPLNGQQQVTPDALQEHRQSHQFLGPCCLCPLFEPKGRVIFTEAVIYIMTSGQFSGEYIAQYAKGDLLKQNK
jgi:hypothetical protein